MDMARAVAAIRGCSKTRWEIAQRIGEWKGVHRREVQIALDHVVLPRWAKMGLI